MYQFPEGFYTDVREETVHATTITIENGVLKENKTKKEQGVIIRLYDGRRWYISSTTESDKVQQEIDSLAGMAVFCPNIEDDPVVKNTRSTRRYNCATKTVTSAWFPMPGSWLWQSSTPTV